jgi:tRNA A58 N-methylase Trm61
MLAWTAVVLLALCAWPPGVTGEPSTQARDDEAEFVEIVRLLDVSTGTVVADVGAGGGSWTFRLATRVGPQGRVFATEVEPRHVEGIVAMAQARGFENVTAILGSQADTGLPSGCCDALLLRLVYHAFDQPTAMRESIHRAMRPGGRVLVVAFRPSAEQLTKEMEDAGFEPLQVVAPWQNRDALFAVLFRKPAW